MVVRIRDGGPGIGPEHQAQIFEKFGRAGGSAKPGTGLGLFLPRPLPRRTAAHSSSSRRQPARAPSSSFGYLLADTSLLLGPQAPSSAR